MKDVSASYILATPGLSALNAMSPAIAFSSRGYLAKSHENRAFLVAVGWSVFHKADAA